MISHDITYPYYPCWFPNVPRILKPHQFEKLFELELEEPKANGQSQRLQRALEPEPLPGLLAEVAHFRHFCPPMKQARGQISMGFQDLVVLLRQASWKNLRNYKKLNFWKPSNLMQIDSKHAIYAKFEIWWSAPDALNGVKPILLHWRTVDTVVEAQGNGQIWSKLVKSCKITRGEKIERTWKYMKGRTQTSGVIGVLMLSRQIQLQ